MIILFVAGLMVFLGIGVKYLKWHFLIAGYNTMSKDRKEHVDSEGLGRLIGNFLIGMGILMAVGYAADKIGFKGLASGLMMAIFPATIVLVAMAQRYDHSKKTGNNAKTRVAMLATISIILGVTVLISGLLIFGILDPGVEVGDEMIVISGMYKRNIRIQDIIEVSLEEQMPEVINKVNGFNMGYALRGSFRLEGEGVSSIFVYENKEPFVFIRTTERLNIVNFRNPEDTEALYLEILEVVNVDQ